MVQRIRVQVRLEQLREYMLHENVLLTFRMFPTKAFVFVL